MKKVLILFFLLCLCIYAYGCKQESKTISFVVEGCEKINDVSVRDLSQFKLPANPNKEGYKFIGWYLDNDFTKEFKGLDDISGKKTTLYAKFERLEEKYTVTFIDEDKVIETITVAKDQKVECKTLSKENYLFLGWYNGETKFESNSCVTKNTTLKAKWILNDIKFSVNENKHILNKEYAQKNAVDGIVTIDNKIKSIQYTNLKKIYFNGTEEDFRKIKIYEITNKDLEIFINNKPINFTIVDEENKDVSSKVTIKVISYLDNQKLDDYSVSIEKNSKLCDKFILDILANNSVFKSYNGLSECFIKLYEDEAKVEEFNKEYFNNVTCDKVIYAYFETSKNFIKDISGKYKTLNDDECEISGYDITIFGKTLTLEAKLLGTGENTFALSYYYSDEIITIELFLGNYYLDGIITIIVLYDFNTMVYSDNYYLVK